MNRHALHYLELNCEPEAAPPLWVQVVGGAVTFAALYLLTVFLFSL